ncbi:unnamed protein product, partial [Soboliphyme baturini]|uniref:Glycoprotein n=1 Tax=Soboliphyme baturini TaxID=241478 RepID=A0A183J919_9BILA
RAGNRETCEFSRNHELQVQNRKRYSTWRLRITEKAETTDLQKFIHTHPSDIYTIHLLKKGIALNGTRLYHVRTRKLTEVPVKQTVPPTAILYISSNHPHLERLKHTIHVVNVVKAPAHDIHVMMLHKHGHSLGGLPPIFWYSLIFLIAVFHLFLFKLIYNEYFHAHVQKPISARRDRYETPYTSILIAESSSLPNPCKK